MEIKTRTKKSTLEDCRFALLAKREELIQRLYARRSEILAERQSDAEVGVALETVVRDFARLNMEREIRTLAEVELSLRRIENGDYGLCGSCGEQIPMARLEALPWTRVCVVCAGDGMQPISRDSEGLSEQGPEALRRNVIRFQRTRAQSKLGNQTNYGEAGERDKS